MNSVALRLMPLLTIVIAVALLAGCPETRPGTTQFTSADLGGNYRDVLNGAPPVLADDTEGGEGGAEREVVEPDVIRRDGNLLYVLNQYRGLSILDLETETLLAQVPTLGYPRDLYLVDGRAYVIVANAGEVSREDDGYLAFDFDSRLFVVDVAEPAAAAVLGSFALAGDLIDSRLVGDVLYAISAEYQWNYEGGGVVAVKQQTSASWVTSINVADPENVFEAATLSFEGYGNIIQATNSALFVAGHSWENDTATITYVDIADPAGAIAVRGAAQVPGAVADRFKMDAWDGTLRVISNTWWQDRQTYVTTISLADPDQLAVLGQTTIPGAEGETLFATRFDGPRAYAVTFLVIDPLFVLDLSDPANPLVAGELKVPGWSTHIEPRGDRLVALGVDDSDGRRVSVSLFDVSVPSAPGLIARESFGESWSWSSAYGDVKALTVTDDTIIVPFSGWTPEGGYDQLQFLQWDRDALSLGSTVPVQGGILRSFQHGDRYYGVTTEQVAVIEGSSLSSLAVTHTIPLAENVIDYVGLASGVRVEVVDFLEAGAVRVRTEDAAGTTLGTARVEIRNVSSVFVHGNSVILVATVYDEEGERYRTAKVDCTDPAAPVATLLDVNVPPYWNYGWYYDGPWGGMPEVDAVAPRKRIAPDIWWPYPVSGDTVFLAGDTLVLRCREADFSTVLGGERAQQGFATVAVDEFAWTGSVGLGYENITAIDGEGALLYLTTKENAANDRLGRAQAAYFLRTIDPAARTAGPEANVPGEFLSHDVGRGLLLTRDWQYRLNGDLETSLRSLQWDGGGEATLTSTFVIDQSHGAVEVSRTHVVTGTYSDGFALHGVKIEADGTLSGAGRIGVTRQWGHTLAINGSQVYVAVGDRAVARYEFAGAAPALLDVTAVMAAPRTLRFFGGAAYGPLGYAGLVELPADATGQ
jgi:hypothetical protein